MSVPCAPCLLQLGNAIGFVPGTLLFAVFGQQGTSVVRSIVNSDYGSPSFYVSLIIIVLGGVVVITTVLLVRRTIKKLKAAGRTVQIVDNPDAALIGSDTSRRGGDADATVVVAGDGGKAPVEQSVTGAAAPASVQSSEPHTDKYAVEAT